MTEDEIKAEAKKMAAKYGPQSADDVPEWLSRFGDGPPEAVFEEIIRKRLKKEAQVVKR